MTQGSFSKGSGYIAAGLGVAGFLWLTFALGSPRQLVVRRECENGYAAARSHAETLLVDARRPVVSRAQASVATTCGELRLAGQLR